MAAARILLVASRRAAVAPLLRGGTARLFAVCAPEEAERILSSPDRRYEGVVWLLSGRGSSGGPLPRLLRMRRDLPFLAMRAKPGSGGSRIPAGFTGVIDGPITAGALAARVRLEARLMGAEAALEESRATTKAQARRLAILSHIAQAANSVLEPRKVMEIVMARAQELIRTEAWLLMLADEKEHTLSFEMFTGERIDKMKDYRVRIGQGVAGWVVQYRRPLIINDVSADRRFDPRFDTRTGFRTRSILCAPLLSRGRIIGAIELLNKKRGRFTREDLAILMTLVEPGAIAIENAILYQKSAELTVTDDLTKLFNSRYLNVHLRREIKRSRRYGTSVSLIFLDLDGFKLVNDNYGHLSGSRALYEVGQVIQETVREIDVVSRYGGDEFTIILPQTSAQGAMIIAERIRAAIEEKPFLADAGLKIRLTASFGVSTYPDHGQNKEELLQRADQAMYLVKDRGRNGVALALEGAHAEKGRIQ